MRLTFRFGVPVEKGNEAVKDGTLSAAIDTLIKPTNPEAVYFTLDGGERTGMIFFDLDDQARLAEINEPFFDPLDAAIDIMPVLNLDDLRRGMAGASFS